ncbi:MAG TPA: hypothetical protein VIM55_17555 [Mucilaginibacter sp.]
MRKITLAVLISIISFCAFGQVKKKTRVIVNGTPKAANGQPGVTRKRNIDKDNIVIDLASATTSVKYQVANNESFKVTFINLAPGAQYSLNDATTVKPISEGLDESALNPEFTGVASGAPDTSTAGREAAAAKQACDDAQAALDAATAETDFVKLFNKAKALNGCIVAANYEEFSTLNYNGGKALKLVNETLVITLTNTSTGKVWTITFDTKDEGKFLTTYGFTYIPYIFEKPKTFYAQPFSTTTTANGVTTTSTSYKLLQGSSETVFDFAPSVLFHYLAYNTDEWSFSYTGGVGININSTDNNGISPVAMAGGSLLFHQNIGLSFGFAFHMMNQLKGKYSPGQIVDTNLESSDINDKVVRFDPFISLTFRFSSSPFKSKAPAVVSGSSGSDQPTAPATDN